MEILFIVYGTGGAEAINVVERVIKPKGYNYRILDCSDFSKSKIENAIRVSEKEVLDSIQGVDLVVSERSNGIEFQNKVTLKCKEMGITNLVITDFHLKGKSDYNKIFDVLPDYVTAISDLACVDLKAMGFKEEQIIKLGNPAYMRLYNMNYKPSFTKTPKILFTSQGGKGNMSHEKLTDFLGSCIDNLDKKFEDYIIDVKLHPMEEEFRDQWLETISKNNWKCSILDIPTSVDFLTEYITDYDLLIGLYSTLQVQGQLVGIPCIFEGGVIEDCLDKYIKNISPLMWEKELDYYKATENEIIEIFDKLEGNLHENR